MDPVMTIKVTLTDMFSVRGSEKTASLVMFTAEADGPLFRGRTVCQGADTQLTDPDGSMSLFARYMLKGIDVNGEPCRIFIENSGTDPSCCTPRIVTDSKALRRLESAELYSSVEPTEGGVTVKIFEK